MVGVWALALLVILISTPLVYQLPEEVLEKQNYPVLVGLVFPVMGVGFLIWAVRLTIRWMRFGKSVLELATLPGVIGGSLAGTIHTTLPREATEGMRLSLRSINRKVRRKHRKRDVREKILWEESLAVPREQLSVGMKGAAVPFSFRVPFDCRETTDEGSDDQIIWLLHAKGAVAGVDYDAEFELPVFRTEDSSSEPVAAAPPPQIVTVQGKPPASSKIRVGNTPAGGKVFYFSAAPNPSAAASLTAFFLIWVGAIWFQVYLGAPIFFPIVFGIFGALIFWAVLDLWFGTTRVVIDMDEVRIRNAILGLGRTRRFQAAEFADVKLKIGMQSGGRSGTPYYQIRLVRRGGRDVIAGQQIKDKREAEWLAEEIKKSLRL
jgi:hypothetical protein